MKIRQDAWSEENDLLLAETVLRHVREGSTQLRAFEEIGDKLDRTAAACGFRWNAVVRKQYEKALGLAKMQRKQRFRLLQKKTKPKELHIVMDDSRLVEKEPHVMIDETEFFRKEPFAAPPEQNRMTMSRVIEFLQQFESTGPDKEIIIRELESVKQEKKEWEMKYRQMEEKMMTIQEDYEALMKIMDRARKMVMFNDMEEKNVTFKMDRNGNLEKIAD